MNDGTEEPTTLALAVARAVAELRQSEHLTLEGLADRSGLHRTTIGLAERGERLLSLAAASRLASAFGMRLSDLIAFAERNITASSDGPTMTSSATVIPRGRKRIVNPQHGENGQAFRALTGVGVEAIIEAIEETYETLDLIDDELRSKGSPPVSGLVELANLSSMIGNLLGAGFAAASGGAYIRNRPHAFPDLVPQFEGLPDLELKTALETNTPKGHLPKAGTYLTFRYVLATKDGQHTRGKANRGDTPWIWEVRCGALREEDFSVSNTKGDSGKTAVIRSNAFKGMTRVFYAPEFLPYANRSGDYGDNNQLTIQSQ
ncbi:helix-turn-helix domain-containing protein [Streptomyces sp. CB02460]|uniref:helix-turn-helix domain-containing protein n=1 Tax=Streptomyces sp. CB02460 TaxID=1703941 RepID=UPI001300E61D|nr:helix-turn-helix domain-containing protein [Streptomyces sp. CB02460]